MRLSSWIIFGLLSCVCLPTVGAQGASLRIDLLNGTRGGGGSAELVEIFDPGETLKAVAQRSGVEGSVLFEGIPSSTAGPSVVHVLSAGVSYRQPVVLVEGTNQLEFTLFEVDDDLARLVVPVVNVVFQRRGDRMEVTELWEISNPTEPPVALVQEPGTIRFSRPPAIAAEEIGASIGQGQTPIRATVLETEDPSIFAIEHALKPGLTRLVLHYFLPYDDEELVFAPTMLLPVEARSILLSPDDIRLDSEGMEQQGTGMQGFAIFDGGPLAAGEAFAIRLEGGSAQAPDPHAELGGGGEIKVEKVPHRLEPLRLWLLLGMGLLMGLGLLFAGAPPRRPAGD